ncbi:carboxylesterase family protein [Mycobacteroides abscessus subsp. bolletii 1513]|uniref:Carboxylesterase family protein n=1 Tax=Mycobacteroides abscessus subsp. bolletii 1513 TaxID=1299321 RepID=X8DF06_9MYCO|nr:carboxylesterase family protein [Mycobacteroides abscessus subsp. bolletii 1513]
MTRLLVAVSVVLAAAVSCSPTKAADPTIVTTRAGAVRGHIDDQVRVFAAIPYAAPPVARDASPNRAPSRRGRTRVTRRVPVSNVRNRGKKATCRRARTVCCSR